MEHKAGYGRKMSHSRDAVGWVSQEEDERRVEQGCRPRLGNSAAGRGRRIFRRFSAIQSIAINPLDTPATSTNRRTPSKNLLCLAALKGGCYISVGKMPIRVLEFYSGIGKYNYIVLDNCS